MLSISSSAFVRGLLIAAVFFVIAIPNSAGAQQSAPREPSPPPPESDGDESEMEQARAHHEAGLAALEAGHFEVAETNFRAALAIAPRASTAYNLGLVLFDRGFPAQALQLYDRVLSGELGELPVDETQLRDHRRQALAASARLVLRTAHPTPLSIELDGNAEGSLMASQSRELLVDPGHHLVVARTSNSETRISLNVVSGQELERNIAIAITSESEPSARPTRRRWPWALAITLVVVASAAVGLGLALRPDNNSGFSEAPIPNVEALTPR